MKDIDHQPKIMFRFLRADFLLLKGYVVQYFLQMEKPKEAETSCMSWLYPQVRQLHYQSDQDNEMSTNHFGTA